MNTPATQFADSLVCLLREKETLDAVRELYSLHGERLGKNVDAFVGKAEEAYDVAAKHLLANMQIALDHYKL